MSRHYVPCIVDFLAETIWKHMKKQIEEEGYEGDRLERTKDAPCVNKIKAFPGFDFTRITDKVIENDLRKVSFGNENVDGKGFKQITEDFVCFLVEAFGDWEVPMYFILYWDGKELRGYIPTEGNPWNTDEKAAYGNNESDEQNAMKRFGVYHEKIRLQSFEPMWQDIRERIVLSPNWNGVICGSKTIFEPTSAVGKILQARPAEAHSLVNQYPVANDEELAQQVVNDLKLALEERDAAQQQLALLKRVCKKIEYVMTDAEEFWQDGE